MKKINQLAFVSIALSFALAACGQQGYQTPEVPVQAQDADTDSMKPPARRDSGPVFEFDAGQLKPWSKGETRVQVIAFDVYEDGKMEELGIGKGKISEKGRLWAMLNRRAEMPSNGFEDFFPKTDKAKCDLSGVYNSDGDAELTSTAVKYGKSGYLIGVAAEEPKAEPDIVLVETMRSDRDANISGFAHCTMGDKKLALEFDLKLKKGWNYVSAEMFEGRLIFNSVGKPKSWIAVDMEKIGPKLQEKLDFRLSELKL